MYYIRIIRVFIKVHLISFHNTSSSNLLSSSIGCGCPTYLRHLKRCLKASVRTLAMLATPTALSGTVGRMVFFLSENREPVYAYFLCTRSVRCLLHFQVHNYERYSLLFVRGSSLSVRLFVPSMCGGCKSIWCGVAWKLSISGKRPIDRKEGPLWMISIKNIPVARSMRS